MCGRFTLTYAERERLAEQLGINVEQISEADYKRRFNIAPTDPHWIVRARYEDRLILPAKWGLVNSWAKDAKRAASQINARAERLQTSPAFRDAFENRRCVVPADGFFEWRGPKDARQPLWFHRADGSLILFAGLYESWPQSPDNWQRTFTIVTTEANNLMAPVHDRMPVILDDDAVDEWLNQNEKEPQRLLELLRPIDDDYLIATPVSQRVNSVKNDDPECLIEVPALL
jgi:putative SOS response-associated peptidase YedK